MLTGIGLRNFKAFGDEMQEAPLSKITLIYGPNSGGKSSIIQALLLLKQSLRYDYYRRSKSGKRELVLNGELVELNSIQSLLHKHDDERYLHVGVRYKNLELGGDTAENSIEMTFADDHGFVHMSEVNYKITSYENEKVLFGAAIDTKDTRGRMTSSERDGALSFVMRAVPFNFLGVDGQKISHLAFTEFLPSLFFPELKRTREQEAEERPLREEKAQAESMSPRLREMVEANEGRRALLDARDRAERATEDEEIGSVLRQRELRPDEILALTPENIPSDYERHLRSVNYLGPLRSAPERLYRLSSESESSVDVTGVEGEFSADVLYHSNVVLNSVNHWFKQFKIPYRLDIISFGEPSLVGEHITIALTDKRTNTQVTLADVGYGINQILPVIIEGIASQEGAILCVEQPEIHLHPRLQANIADLMIDSIDDVPGKQKQWIVETHSELLILRLQRRIREGKIKPEDISVLYVDPNDNSVEGSAIKVLRLGEDSYFKDPWPDGFFDEGLRERLPDDDELQGADDDTNILDKLFSE